MEKTYPTGQKVDGEQVWVGVDYVPDQHLSEGLRTYTVILEPLKLEYINWEFFICEAEDSDHAEEQARDAEPDYAILWVNEGLNFMMEGMEDT